MKKMKVGDSAKFSKTISESDVYMFAGVTGDFNSVHIDKEYAKKSIFGDRIVHGMLTASMISTVLGTKLPGPGTIFLEQNIKFKHPVYFGDTVEVELVLDEIISSEKGILKFVNRILNQHKTIVVEGYSVVKIEKDKLEDDKNR